MWLVLPAVASTPLPEWKPPARRTQLQLSGLAGLWQEPLERSSVRCPRFSGGLSADVRVAGAVVFGAFTGLQTVPGSFRTLSGAHAGFATLARESVHHDLTVGIGLHDGFARSTGVIVASTLRLPVDDTPLEVVMRGRVMFSSVLDVGLRPAGGGQQPARSAFGGTGLFLGVGTSFARRATAPGP
ncbi:MAG: hypothetical protein H6736_21360 [Alphaproteobacteria bacterium]|nr:hypothetical protein [Alphaproteobacteria bacterium]